MLGKSRFKSSGRQAGFTLLEISIASIIMAGIIIGILYYKAQELSYQMVRAQVDQLKVLNSAVSDYESVHYSKLMSATPTAITAHGYTVPASRIYTPTVQDLKGLRLLDGNFSEKNLYGAGGYATLIRTSPAGCTAGSSCMGLFGLTYVVNQITSRHANGSYIIDPALAGEALTYGGGDMGMSGADESLHPNIISGIAGAWSEPNPLGSTPGIIAMRSGAGTQLRNSAYLRLDGTNSMNADLNVGGNSIVNTHSVSALQDITTSKGAVIARAGNVIAQGNGVASGFVQGAVVQSTGAILASGPIQGGSVNSGGNITANGTITGTNVTVSGSGRVSTPSVYLSGSPVTIGAACSPNGLMAKTAPGMAVSCVNGVWFDPSQSTQGDYSAVGSYHGYFIAVNNTGRALFITATGGQDANASNNCDLKAVVNGVQVAQQTIVYKQTGGNTSTLTASCSIAFMVSANRSYIVSSNPPAATSPGTFSIYQVQ